MAEETKKLDDAAILLRTPKNLPKANILRISVLSPGERQKYLGGIDAALDSSVRTPIYKSIYGNNDPVFYGTVQGDGDLGFGLTATWNKSASGGSIGGMLRNFATNTTLGSMVGAAGDILRSVTGINASATGSATMRSYESGSLDGFSVDCAWYLPEQYDLCILSLRTLTRMAYPVQVPDGELSKSLTAAVNTVKEKISEENRIGENADGDKEDFMSSVAGSDSSGKLTGAAINLVENGSNLLGSNFSLDPIPVRCAVGHYIDLEPLVIENIKVNFSKDQFVHPDSGRHLPLVCSVTITFGFWMTPAPKVQFMNLLGAEMFGEGLPNEYLATAKHAFDAKTRADEASKQWVDNMSQRTDMNPNNFNRVASVNDLPPIRKNT